MAHPKCVSPWRRLRVVPFHWTDCIVPLRLHRHVRQVHVGRGQEPGGRQAGQVPADQHFRALDHLYVLCPALEQATHWPLAQGVTAVRLRSDRGLRL